MNIQFFKDVSFGYSDEEVAARHRLDISEVRLAAEEIRVANREALHNRIRGMFLMGFTIAELPKYFVLTESEIRAILQPTGV